MSDTRNSGEKKQSLAWFAGIMAVVFAAGVILTTWTVRQTDAKMREALLFQARLVAQGAHIEQFAQLTGDPSDATKPQYMRLKAQLIALKQNTPACRFIYLMARRPDGSIIYLADSEPETSQDYSPPGQVFHEASAALNAIFDTRTEFTEGPINDRWGTWVSALVPLQQSTGNGLPQIVGMDIARNTWYKDIAIQTLAPVMLTASLMAVLTLGMVLLRLRKKHPERFRNRVRHVELALALALGLVLTVYSARTAARNERFIRNEVFSLLAADRTGTLSGALFDLQEVELAGLARFFEYSGNVTPEKFHVYITSMKEYKEIVSWAWAPIVSVSEKDAFEAAQRAAGRNEFRIWRHPPTGDAPPPQNPPAHYPICFIETDRGSTEELGYDLGSDPARRDALEDALRTGLPAASEPVSLWHNGRHCKCMYVFKPLFSQEIPRRPIGVLQAALCFDSLFERLTWDTSTHLEIALVREDGALEPVASEKTLDAAVPDTFFLARPIFSFGKVLFATARADKGFLRLHPSRSGWFSGITALSLTLLMTFALAIILRHRTELELVVSAKTASLGETMARFREEKEFNQLLLDTTPAFIVAVGRDGKTKMMNQALLEALEYDRDEVLEKEYLTTFVPEEDREQLIPILQGIFDHRETPRHENRIMSKSGKKYLVEWRGRIMNWGEAPPNMFVGVGIDITERKREEEALFDNERRARTQRAALAQLLLDRAIISNDIPTMINRILEILAETFDVARASIWILSDDRRELRCLSLYEAGAKRFSGGEILLPQTFPTYFDAIMTENRVYVEDARNDPRTRELTEFYLEPLGIVSLLDAGVLIEGKLAGLVSCEHVGLKRKWRLDEEAFLSTIAAIVAQLFINAERKRNEEELRKLAAVVTHSRELVNLANLDGKMIFLNKAGGDMLGVDIELPEDVNIMEVIPGPLHDHVRLDVLPALYKHGVWQGDLQCQNLKTGALTDVYTTAFIVKDTETEAPLFLADVSLDITAQKRAEKELLEERRRLAATLEGTYAGTWEWNVQTGETVFNERWAEILGYSLEELAPVSVKTWERFTHPDDLAASYAVLERHFAGELDYYEIEARMRHKDGHWVWILDRGKVSVWMEDGKPLLMQGTHQDITSAVLSRQLIAAKNRELEQIVYVASHDLRSPLVNVDGYARELEFLLDEFKALLDENDLGKVHAALRAAFPEAADALRHIRNSSRQMDALLKGLLRLSRSGRAALSIGPLDMNELIGRVVSSLEFQLQESGAVLTVDKLPPCLGDAVQVTQIFSNLLGNAIKFLEPTRQGVLRIGAAIGLNQIVYCVEDNGIGIAPEHQGHIFDLFHRLEPEKTEGEGLGLTIVRQIAGRLDGAVWVDSRSGVGSCFYVALPRIKDEIAERNKE